MRGPFLHAYPPRPFEEFEIFLLKNRRFRKEMSDACIAQLVRAVDRQSKDPGSNPGTIKSVSFSTERFQIVYDTDFP